MNLARLRPLWLIVLAASAVVAAEPATKLVPHPDAVPNLHPPGEVDVPELVPFVVADPASLPGIVVDDTAAVLVGKWQYSTHTPPYVGLGYLHDMKAGKGEKSVTFTPDLPRDGLYEVRLAHCYNVRRATNTPVTIHHADGETTVRINQQQQPEHDKLFRSLGTFRFAKGREGWVRVSNQGSDAGKVAIADAVQWLDTGIRPDIEFAKVGDESLQLDAFVPPGDGPFPTCVLVHGGGFMRGDKRVYIKPLFEPLSRAGFTWFSINYRLAPAHHWPACADDVATAIRWVHEHAEEYKVDTKRIALIGESAGGHLVSWIGTQPEPGVAAVVPFYAPHDLELQVDNRRELGPSMIALFGLTELNDAARQTLRAASPSTHVRSQMPPYLLIHGDADAQVPYEQSPRFRDKMQAAGNTCDLITIADGAHGMGGWDKLNSDYREQLIAWLRKTLDVR